MYILKSRFNEKWQELRTFKYQLVEESKKSLSKIEKIDQLLHVSNVDTSDVHDITLNPSAYLLSSLSVVSDNSSMPTSALSTEWPECRNSYTATELNDFSLEVRRKGLINAKAPPASTIPAVDSLSDINENLLSGMDNASEYEIYLIALERKTLIENLNNLIAQYEEKLSELGRERVHIQADLKAAELNLIILIQEYAQLLNFEHKDHLLSSKLSKYTLEKAEMSTLIAECQAQLAERKKEIANWQVRENKLNADFADLMKSAGKDYVTILTKIYKKKIKRAKKRPEGEEDDEDEDSEDESDDEDYDDEEEEEEEIVEDTCPEGCDTSVHAKVLTLREIRLDLEEELQEFTKSVEDIKKMNDRYTQRTKQITKDLAQAGKEIRSFQTEKQIAMNELLTAVPLSLQQLYTVDVDKVFNNPDLRGVLPMTEDAAMTSYVIMNRETLQELEKRIKYSEDAVKTEKINFRNLHKQRHILEKEKKNKEIAIDEMDRKCIELQMLKFGQIIDLEKLDQNQVENPEEDILKDKVSKLESMFDDELKKIKASNQQYKAKLLDVTKVNTQMLAQVASLSGKQLLMEKELNNTKSGNGGLVADDEPLLKLDTDEKKKLTHLVALQTKELDVLKAEINLLRRKGGLVYAGSSS